MAHPSFQNENEPFRFRIRGARSAAPRGEVLEGGIEIEKSIMRSRASRVCWKYRDFDSPRAGWPLRGGETGWAPSAPGRIHLGSQPVAGRAGPLRVIKGKHWGVSSGRLRSQRSQEKRSLNRLLRRPERRSTTPSENLKASSTESVKRDSSPDLTTSRSTTTSMVCLCFCPGLSALPVPAILR